MKKSCVMCSHNNGGKLTMIGPFDNFDVAVEWANKMNGCNSSWRYTAMEMDAPL